jgi:hypothetical protein
MKPPACPEKTIWKLHAASGPTLIDKVRRGLSSFPGPQITVKHRQGYDAEIVEPNLAVDPLDTVGEDTFAVIIGWSPCELARQRMSHVQTSNQSPFIHHRGISAMVALLFSRNNSHRRTPRARFNESGYRAPDRRGTGFLQSPTDPREGGLAATPSAAKEGAG